MRRFVPRAVLTAAVAVSAACSAPSAGVELGSELVAGRFLVMVPALEGPSGEAVANQLRSLITAMPTHAAISNTVVETSMAEYGLEQLDEITARQLAQEIPAQLVSWGSVVEGGAGLQADIRFIDIASGDQIEVQDATGATPAELAAAIFARFSGSVEGIRQAAYCNDDLANNQFDSALEMCESALALVPNSVTALSGKATALLRLERDAEALQAFEQLLEIDPAHEGALLGAGLAAIRLGRADGMTFYNRYLEVNPGNVDVRLRVANDIAQAGDFVSAFRVLEPAIAENAANRDYQLYVFAIATAAGQRAQEGADAGAATPIYNAALRAFQAAYPAGTEIEVTALRQAIAVNTALGRTDEAIRLSSEATERFADDPQVWSQYATMLTTANRLPEAITALDRVIQIDPGYENAYVRRAQAHLDLGHREPALADLALAAQGGNAATAAQVLYALGAREMAAENFAEAVSVLGPAYGYASGPSRSDIAFFYGYSLFRQAEGIARDNGSAQAAQPAREALALFQASLAPLQESTHASAAQVLAGSQAYITNQQAIISLGR